MTLTSVASLFSIVLFLFFGPQSSAQVVSDTSSTSKVFAEAVKLEQNAKYDSSIALLEGIIPFYQKLQAWDLLVGCYNLIGWAYYKKGDHATARAQYGLALAVGVEDLPEQTLPRAETYYYLATLLNSAGEYQKAIEYHERSLEIKKALLGLDHIEISNSYHNLGVVYYFTGDYDKALDHYNSALSIQLKNHGELHIKNANSYNNIAMILNNKGDYEKAKTLYEKSIAIKEKLLDPDHPSIGRGYNNLGAAYYNLKEYSKAIEHTETCLAIWLKAYGENHQGVAGCIYNLGVINSEIGNYGVAADHYVKALEIRKATLGPHHPFVADTYFKIAELQLKLSNIDSALSNVQRSISSLVPGFKYSSIYDNPVLVDVVSDNTLLEVLGLKAKLLAVRSQSDAATENDLIVSLETFDMTSGLIDRLRSSFKAEGSKLFLGGISAKIYENAIGTAFLAHQKTGEYDYLETAFRYAEKGKASVFLAQFMDSEAIHFSKIPDSLLQTENELKARILENETEIQKTAKAKGDQDSVVLALQKETFELKNRYDDMIKYLEITFPDYFDLKYRTEPVTMKDVQDAIGESTMVLEYFMGDSTVFALCISKKDVETFSFPRDSVFDLAADSYYKALRTFDKKKYLDSGHMLFEKLIGPVAAHVDLAAKLIVIPHGIINYVPFEALLFDDVSDDTEDFQKLPYLVTKCEVAYHNSASLYLALKMRVAAVKTDGFLGFAPVFSDSADNGHVIHNNLAVVDTSSDAFRSVTIDGVTFDALPYSATEVQSILGLFRDNKKPGSGFLFRDASEENFRKNVSRYKFIHIATHGLVDVHRPRLSGVVFSQEKEAAKTYDGVIFEGEVFGLNLNADLVVLSSCESGIGKLVKGEGLLALTRSFLYAGADNIVFSLWKVLDRNTSKFMLEFYKPIIAGETYSSSLRKAKLKMIQDESTAFPANWAGFILIGR